MNDPPDEKGPQHGSEDLGEPVLELKEFEEGVSTGFLNRIRSALQRRSVLGQVATLAWTASAQALFEFLGMIFSLFDSGEPKEGGSD